MSGLESKKCVPCEGGATPLTPEVVHNMLQDIEHWTLKNEGKDISRTFRFKNYFETISFVNAVAWIAHQEDHHPELEVAYNRCLVNFSTHAIGGLSENDFICAAKVNKLLPSD